MANNEIKTNAEIYREQRKARLAKAAKKKKSGKSDKIIAIVIKVLCIVIAASLVLFLAGKALTNIFFVPQKYLSAATYGEEKLTVAEYNYYYKSLYSQAISVSSQYDSQYGSGAGSSYFNTMVSPSEQEYQLDDAPEGVETWADYFRIMTPERGFLMKALYNDAMDNKNFELTEDQKKEIEDAIQENIDELLKSADKADYGLDAYIAKACGEGLTEESYRELLYRDSVAQLYLSWYQENAGNDLTDKEINDYYKKNQSSIDLATFRFFTISYAQAEDGNKADTHTQDEAKDLAEKFVNSVSSETDFIASAREYAPDEYKSEYEKDTATLAKELKMAVLEPYSEEMAKWTFDHSRTSGEIKAFNVKSDESYWIVYIVNPAHKNTTTSGADVRHLLVQASTTTTENGETVQLEQDQIDKNFAKAEAQANTLLEEWKAGKATEESFADLVKLHTDDEASAETGGLYEDVNTSSNYVSEFLEWSLAEHKPGDTGIIKTDYGYHIMYYVGADKTQQWETDIRSAIAAEAHDDYFNGLFDDITEKVEKNDDIMNFFAKRIEKDIDRNIANASQNALSSVTY